MKVHLPRSGGWVPGEKAPNSLLVIKPSSLGDIIHALPCVSAIRKAWPDCRISWVVNDGFQGILENNPVVDHVIPFPRNHFNGARGFLRAIPWFLNMRENAPQLALDLQGLFRSALMAKASRANFILGMSDAREGARIFYDQIVEVSSKNHAVDRLHEVLSVLGIQKPITPEFVLPEKYPTCLEGRDRPYVVIHPFSRGQNKALPESILRAIFQQGSDIQWVLVGKGEIENLPTNVEDLSHQTNLPELVWLLRHAQAVVSVDSGPAHIATAVNPRVLAIHTWSDPAKVGPYGLKAWVWKGGEITHVPNLSLQSRQQNRNVEEMDVPKIVQWVYHAIQATHEEDML